MKGQMGTVEEIILDSVEVKMQSGEHWFLHQNLLKKDEGKAHFVPQRGFRKGDRVKVKDLNRQDMTRLFQNYGMQLDTYVSIQQKNS